MTDPARSSPAREHRFPCAACGATMRFDPAAGLLRCDYCGATRPATASPPEATAQATEATKPGPRPAPIVELDFRAAIEARLPQAETETHRTLACTRCGAMVEHAEERHAMLCPFCATPLVIGTGAHRQIKPQGVLPFAMTEAEARDAMTAWLGSLWFAPGGLSAYARKGRRLTGIYLPFWTFDARTDTIYEGDRGTVHHSGTGKDRRSTVRWRRVRGRVARAFDDVLVPASPTLPRAQADALEPWDLAGLEPYRPEFLAGFLAEAYRVPVTEAHDIARARMDAVIQRDICFDIGGDRQRIRTAQTRVSDVTFKHVLLPVWTAAYRFRGRSFNFVVNARTGRVQGERPWSPWKIGFAILLAVIAGAALAWLNGAAEGRF